MNNLPQFDELSFIAQVKKRPGMFLGERSLLSLRDQLFGMEYAFSFYTHENPLKYFREFITWYNKNMDDTNGYACWWNHILYISGNDDALAFDTYMKYFERYLSEFHNLRLPEVK